MKPAKIHCSTPWLLPFPHRSAPYFNSVREVQRHHCSTGMREDGVGCRATAKLVSFPCLNWRAGCSSSFCLSTRASSQIRKNKLLLAHVAGRWKQCCQPFQWCSHKSWLPSPIKGTFKVLVIWQLLRNIIKSIIPALCITSKSDTYPFMCPEVKSICAKWGHGNCFINFALKHAVMYSMSTQKKMSATCSPNSQFSTYLAITTEKWTFLSLCRYHVYLTMALYKNQLCIMKMCIQD